MFHQPVIETGSKKFKRGESDLAPDLNEHAVQHVGFEQAAGHLWVQISLIQHCFVSGPPIFLVSV